MDKVKTVNQILSEANKKGIDEVFSVIYREHLWSGGDETRSGGGSTTVSTGKTVPALIELLNDLSVKSMADVACGDGAWILEVTRNLELYVGYDIVEDIVIENIKRASLLSLNNHFYCQLNCVDKTPMRFDAILFRDCAIHIPNEDIIKTINNFKKSGTRYLITTCFFNQDMDSDFGKRLNGEVRYGGYRRVDLTLPPFNYPDPMRVIEDPIIQKDGEESIKHKGRSLAVWELVNVPMLKTD